MSIEETRALWEKFKAADQTHDAEATANLYAEDVVFKGTGLRGRAALKSFDASFFAAFPDYKREYVQEVVGEDTIAFAHHYTATHTGPWMGIPPTGLTLDVRGCSFLKVRDGHFSEVLLVQSADLIGQLRREANLQLVRRLYQAENEGELDAFGRYLAADVQVWISGRLSATSREEHVTAGRGTSSAFPDWRHETLAITCDGDLVTVRWRAAGTHSAAWAGIPASGNRVEFHGTSSVEVKDGLMQRIWIDMDMAGPIAHMTR